jgi:enoyl-[acyl-carrier protein] reductase I
MSIAKAALEAWVREIAARLGPDGHRVNAISAGPIKTLAASGIPGFEGILDHVERNSPLRRNVDQMDVAGAATWLASPLSSGVTAQVIHVDGGYSSTMVPEDVNR